MPGDNENIELADIIQQATETKITVEAPVTEDVNEPEADRFKNDFDETILNEAANEQTGKLDEAAQNALFDSSQLAPVIIEGADTLIKQLFPVLYEKTAFTKDELIGMKAFSYKQRLQANKRETVIEHGDEKYAAMVEEYEAYVNGLPLTEVEKKSILQPLKEVLKGVNYQTSPGNALLIAVALVMLPRAMPVVSKNFFDKKEDKK